MKIDTRWITRSKKTLWAATAAAASSLLISVLLTCSSVMHMTEAPPTEMDNRHDDAEKILRRYAEAWRGEEEMTLDGETTLGFWIKGDGGGRYHIILPTAGTARLVKGEPEQYTVGFETDIETLRRLDRGEWNALTAMGQARGEDPIPLLPKMPEGFEWTAENRAYFISLFFHFWNRQWPEKVRFGEGTTREVHGGNAVVFFYQSGLRSAWYQVKPGMHVNADPEDQTNQFPTFVIMTRGELNSRLGGGFRLLREGEAIFIPAGMAHEFWADAEQYGEFVILMFGEGA